MEEALTDVSEDRQRTTTTQGFEPFFATPSALSFPLNVNSFKVKEWSNLGHKGIGVNKQDD